MDKVFQEENSADYVCGQWCMRQDKATVDDIKRRQLRAIVAKQYVEHTLADGILS